MAKRKNSTALFEVMRAAQQKALERHSASLQNPASPQTPAAAPNGASHGGPSASNGAPTTPPPATVAPTPARSYAPPPGQSQLKPLGTPSIVSATRRFLAAITKPKANEEASTRPAVALDPDDPTAGMTADALRGPRSRVAEPNPEQAFVDADEEPEVPPAASRPAPAPSSSHAQAATAAAINKVAIDRDRQEVTVKVRFQTVAIGVIATLAVVGLAYIAGKKTGAPAAKAPTTPEIKNGPVQPGVLDPRGNKTAVPGDARLAGERVPGAPSAAISPSLGGSTTIRTGEAGFLDSPVVNGRAERDVGLNYCVIESFAPNQQQWALDVRDFLNAAGINCTIEIGRPSIRTRAGDYLIVGTRGFAPRYGNTPAYLSYVATIEQVAGSFPDKTKFRQPQMMMVKWVAE